MQRCNLTSRVTAFVFLALSLASPSQAAAETLFIGYSDWPGWVAWEVAVEKGWFAEAGVDVQFEWFDYAASMEAFAASQLDAVTMTNGDALVTGSTNYLSDAGRQEVAHICRMSVAQWLLLHGRGG